MFRKQFQALPLTFEVPIVFILVLLASAVMLHSPFLQTGQSAACITYDSSKMVITIKCETANLTNIDEQLIDPNIYHLSPLNLGKELEQL